MFENMTEDQAKKQILKITKEYHDIYHKRNWMKTKKFFMRLECMIVRKCAVW